VDRKASKNRKIRYVVHDKMLNFMAPIDTHGLVDENKANVLKFLFG
jgi:protein AATF/BFR2